MSESGIELPLEDGMRIAHEFLSQAKLYKGSTIVGSIRRHRPVVHDIDIILDVSLNCFAQTMCDGPVHLPRKRIEVLKWGQKLAAVRFQGVPIDLYFSTLETLYTLLLIRTGSKENNIRLATIAKRRGWKLHASGDGLFNERGERIAGDSERSIYDALGVPWQEPWERG